MVWPGVEERGGGYHQEDASAGKEKTGRPKKNG